MTKQDLITRILEAVLPPDLHHLIGDLEEEFNLNKEKEGIGKARFRFWWQVIRTTPWFVFQSLIWNIEMLYNYLIVTWRNLKKHLGFSLINILGLAASMSVCLLIILFIADQRGYDRFHENSDRIQRVIIDFKSPGNNNSSLYATTPASLAGTLEEQYPEVEKAVKIRGNFSGEFRFDDTVVPLNGFHADTSFFSVFGFELLKGDPLTALDQPGSIILTPESATKIFGDEEAMGKTITGLGDRDYTVTGIIDSDVKTHFRYEVIASYSTLTSNTESQAILDNWKNSIYDSYTYLLINKDADLENFEANIQSLIKAKFDDPTEDNVLHSLQLQPLTKINLGPALSNEIGMVVPNFFGWFLGGFAFIIILIAGFNYVSLTIARSINRGKEVGVRKVLGAHRFSVIQQFLFESVLIAFLALLFGGFLLRWLLPEFNSLLFISFTENQVEPGLIANPEVIAAFVVFTVLVGILAGLYPALFLSKFAPARVLKGIVSVKSISGQALKKTLTVSQFTFSLVFIITSMIMFQQFRHMADTEYGFNTENIVHIALQDVSFDQLKYHIEKNPDAVSVSTTSTVPALGSINGAWIESDSIETRLRAHSFNVDENYIRTMGLNLLAGRNFNPELTTDTSQAVIISDQAALQLGFHSPSDALTKEITVRESSYTVIGVIQNFISADVMRAGDPIVLLYRPGHTRYAIVKTAPGKMTSFISDIEKDWLSLNSLHSIKYQVFDDQLRESPQLIVFTDFIKVLGLVAGFSILISCLGLLGMAMYSAENRVKEIGIRKVLGASFKNIVFLLSKEYIVLIVIALGLGVPGAWFFNKFWMQIVTNKVPLGPGVFITGSLVVVLLALVTVGSQAIKAARANSIENLRSE